MPYPGSGPPAGPGPHAQPGPGWSAPAFVPPVGPGAGRSGNTAKILAVVAAGVIVLALCAFGSLRAYGMVSRMVAHNASSSNSDRTPERTTGNQGATTGPSYEPPSRAASPTPSFDPNTMNDAGTDRTPQTSDALLPNAFTDDTGRRFTLKAAGSWSCVTTSQTKEVQDLLTLHRCVSAMTGSYVDDGDTILVSVKVRALADRATAKTVHAALAKTSVGASGIYCPKSGPGATVCEADYSDAFKRAVKKGQVGSEYRYVIDADAVYVDMREDTNAGPALQSAVEEALSRSGPANYTGD